MSKAEELADKFAKACVLGGGMLYGKERADLHAHLCALEANRQMLVEALSMARDLLVDLEGYEPEGPSVSVIDAALEQAKELT